MFTWISNPITGYLPEFALLGLLDRERTKVHYRFFFDGKTLRAPRIHSRIQKLQPHLPFLLGARLADPDHPAALGVGHVFIEDKFDNLTAPEVETSADTETFFRRIDDEAGESLGLAVQIDD